jgi:hypothetical protein
MLNFFLGFITGIVVIVIAVAWYPYQVNKALEDGKSWPL